MKNKEKVEVNIIFGPPGAGKTLMARYMSNLLGLDIISWGNIYRSKFIHEAYKKEIKLLNDAKVSTLKRSKAIASIIEKELGKIIKISKKGLVIEGFPRRSEEAKILIKILKKHNCSIKSLIRINPSLETAFNRYASIMCCPKCKYHYEDFLETKVSGFCDLDGERLEKQQTDRKLFSNDFYLFIQESNETIKYLKPYAEMYFDVSGDEDEVSMFSNIVIKMKNKIKSDSKIFKKQTESTIETIYGKFKMITYQSRIDYSYHLALVKGKVKGINEILVRVHSSCITGDLFGSCRCDCADQLHESLKIINENRKGVLIYLFQEGRGINIINKIQAYKLQRKGFDTVEANELIGLPAEMREYFAVKNIIDDLKIKSICLLTNNPDKINKITDLGIIVHQQVPIEIKPGKYNEKYLLTKKVKMGHRLKNV